MHSLKRYLSTHVHSSIIQNSQKASEAIQLSNSEWMAKQTVVYIYNRILHNFLKSKFWHLLQHAQTLKTLC